MRLSLTTRHRSLLLCTGDDAKTDDEDVSVTDGPDDMVTGPLSADLTPQGSTVDPLQKADELGDRARRRMVGFTPGSLG